MDNQKKEIIFHPAINFIIFTSLFTLIVILIGKFVFTIAPNTNSLFGVFFSFICALPLAFTLFFNPKFIAKVKPYQRFLLPALIFPLCILLSLGWNLYQQMPENLFRLFVMDPIPEGVSNIRGHDVSGGFDMEIFLIFNATPEAIDKIIAKNELNLYVEKNETFFIEDADTDYFEDISWNRNWTTYFKSYSDERIENITIWISPQGDTVLFRFVSG